MAQKLQSFRVRLRSAATSKQSSAAARAGDLADIGAVMNLSPLVPPAATERTADAVPLAEALLEGGVAVIEVMLHSDAALAAIEAAALTRRV